MEWIFVKAPDTEEFAGGESIPEWLRTLGYDEETGDVFAPAAFVGEELQIVACAASDGVPVAFAHRHPYVPVDWLAKEFPRSDGLYQSLLFGVMRAKQKFGIDGAAVRVALQ